MRDKQIRLDSTEKELLRDIRRRHWDESVPYGHVVAELCRFYESERRTSNVEW